MTVCAAQRKCKCQMSRGYSVRRRQQAGSHQPNMALSSCWATVHISNWQHKATAMSVDELLKITVEPAKAVQMLQLNRSLNPLKLHSNGPLYSNIVIGTLAVDGWAVTFDTARRDMGALQPHSASLTVPVNSQCTNVHVIIWCGTIITFALQRVNQLILMKN